MLQENIEAMQEILQLSEIEVNEQTAKEIAESYEMHLDCIREMYSNQFIGMSKRECDSCVNLKEKIINLEKEIEVYKNSVKQRRNASSVWVENGSVMYEH